MMKDEFDDLKRILLHRYPQHVKRLKPRESTASIPSKVDIAAMMFEFYRCPTSGKIIEALHDDDKVICDCGRSNPNVPTERTEHTGTHVVRYLQKATAEQYVQQEEARKVALEKEAQNAKEKP